ncbi:TPA: phosphate ABC transporter permease [Candidatus Woesebacteria bacterium]|nr:phosphate ABC transporter permease [Candidatus Woesebacteria bacterium]
MTIKPRTNPLAIDFAELWRYRELFVIFAWRDIKVRYKQTFLGGAWAIFQPLVSTFIFTIFFGRLAKIPSGALPYALFVLCGLVFWNFFSGALTHASNSLIENENIVKKVYFPRLILPLSSIITSFIDFGISLVMMLIFAIVLGFIPSLMFIPILIIGILIAGIGAGGLGLFLSAFNVKYRDVRYILPFFIQTMLFLTPVIYPTSIVSNTNKYIMAINPMTGVIEAIRVTIAGTGNIDWILLGLSAASTIFFFIIGLVYFRQTEAFFADIV